MGQRINALTAEEIESEIHVYVLMGLMMMEYLRNAYRVIFNARVVAQHHQIA